MTPNPLSHMDQGWSFFLRSNWKCHPFCASTTPPSLLPNKVLVDPSVSHPCSLFWESIPFVRSLFRFWVGLISLLWTQHLSKEEPWVQKPKLCLPSQSPHVPLSPMSVSWQRADFDEAPEVDDHNKLKKAYWAPFVRTWEQRCYYSHAYKSNNGILPQL